MAKYISLVQANVNDISQLKKEIEYLSDFTEDIELVNKIFVQVDLFFWTFVVFAGCFARTY